MSVTMIRRRARALMWLVTVPLAGLALLALLLLANVAWQGGRYLDGVAIHYLPMCLYIWAIWMIRSALRAIADGALFDHVLPKLLFRVGLALFGGALFTVFGIPLVTAILSGSPYFDTFEPSPVTLGVVGAALMLLSMLLAHASEMRDEIAEFF